MPLEVVPNFIFIINRIWERFILTYTAGSVNAKIELDTSQFDKAIKDLKKDIGNLKSEFNSNNGVDKFTKEINELKAKVESLTKVNEDYRKQLNNLRKGQDNVTKSAKKASDAIKNETKDVSKFNEALVSTDKSTKLFRQNFDSIKTSTYLGKDIAKPFLETKKAIDEATESTKRFETETGKAVRESIRLREANGESNRWGGHKPVDGIRPSELFGTDWEQVGFEIGKKGLQDFLKVFADAKIQIKRDAQEIENAIRKFASIDYMGSGGTKFDNFGRSLLKVAQNAKKANEALGNIKPNTSQFEQFVGVADRVQSALKNISPAARDAKQTFEQLKSSTTGFAPVAEKAFTAATEGAEKYRERLKLLAEQTKATFETMQVELAKANAAQYKYWQQVRGMSNVKGWNAEPLKVKGYNDYLKAANAVSQYNKQLERNIQLEKQRRSAAAAKDSIAYSTKNFQAASAGMQLLNNRMAEYERNISKSASETKKFGNSVRDSGRGITTFNNGVVQTAHSGRILSNTLYQIRGALLSLKMIATAMGGMALWGFAMDIAEGVKQTFTAKNEMEAQLNQNTKVGASGINTFNRALDGTIERFAKINKYALGETVSSIGLEFELTSKQMEKAMPIVAMIQSEYVRAGRTSEEAALAVKDILQGEFQRLSRETGVGKEELLAYGWSGDKEDVESLLDALKKAAEDRHWDTFAEKATSLNDVIQITKSRFEEFGADLLQAISPMVVSGFNTIIDIITGLQKAFNGLGSFGKNSIVAGGVLGGLVTLGTALPMITKGMGLADIATIGWGKSIATAALNLNKASVAQYGFRKALAEVITGTKASELATVRSTKAIMGRILGVNQSILKEHGYGTALVQSRAKLMNHTGATNIAKISSMGLAQKTAYLTNNMKLQDAQALSTSRAVLKTATSFKVLKAALMGILAIGIVAWYTSLATWADTVKKNIDGLNEVIDNGDEMLKDAEKSVTDYESALSKLTEGTNEYKKASKNLEIAKANKQDIEVANTLAKKFKEQNEETEKSISNMHKAQKAASYMAAGVDPTAATERASGWTAKVIAGQQALTHSMEVYEDRLYKSSQHVNEHVKFLKEAGVSQEKMVKYIDEYSAKAEEVAEYWKKFNQGDLTAGAYAVLGELQLMWIDLWNDEHFVNFWESVKKTWRDVKPTVDEITKALGDLGHSLLDFFSTGQGQIVGGAIAIGGAIALIGYKIAPTLKKLKDFASTIGDALGKLKDWKKESGDSDTSDKKSDDKTTGGINGDIEGKGSGSFKTDMSNILKNRAKSFVNNALLIAEAMTLMTEAILLLNAPMWALAATGWNFKQLEPQIRKGIEGLQLVAPTILALLVPTVALMTVMGYFKVNVGTLTEGFLTAAVGIAMGITLVTEAILLLNAPIMALGALGWVYGQLQGYVEQGIKAMQACNDALMALVPWIPVFVAGIVLAAAASTGIGAIGLVEVALGIAIGISLVTEAILLLNEPLIAIAALGNTYTNLDGVQEGAEALKVTAEALKYVEQGVASLVTVQWDILKSNLASLLGVDMGTALDDLVKDDGFLPKLSKFAEKFNGLEFTPINQDKATALANTANGITAVNDAMKAVKTAMENLPEEFKKGGNGNPSISYDPETDSTSIVGSATDTEGYFDTLIEPLKQLKDFIDKFNNSPELDFGEGIDTAKVEAIKSASNMIVEIKGAVDNVKQTMGMIADAGWDQNMASGGIGAAISGWISGLNPGGSAAEGYSSSLGSSLKEMENVVKDIVTFNNNINTLVSGGNGDGNGGDTGGAVNAMANMVTAVDQAIQNLVTTLQNAVPTAKSAANGIGTGIREGIKTGIGDLTTITVQPLTQALTTAKSYGHTYGQGVGYQTTEGYKTGLKIKSATESEISGTLTYLDSKKQEFYDKGKALGDAVSQGYKDGNKMHSPGIIATSTFQEMAYVEQAFDEAIAVIPAKAEALGASLAESYSPQIATDVGLTDMTAFESGLAQIGLVATDTDMITTNAFNNMNMSASTSMTGMTTSINGAFTNINVNATQSYAKLTNTTRTSLKNMQDQTTKNISAIKTSWKGMQVALIASAEQIRSETSSKIHQLESNMASFWNKIQNPANLLSAGNPMMAGHTRPQRRPTGISSNKGSRRMLAAGHPALGQRVTGISDRFKSIGSDSKTRERFAEYLQCLLNGGACAAGGSGWHFNWSKEIQDVFMQWHTHFGDIYDPYLRVGKFENDDFPVRGISEIALRYIEDAIGRTSYEFYYDERYSPLEAWNRGSFNCVDGANLAIAFANAFGFPGGSLQYTTWDGIGHAYASIPGLGVIDATAIQGGYGLTASKVSYAGNPHTVNRNTPTARSNVESGNTIQGNVVFNIEINGDIEDAEEKGKEVGRKASEVFISMFKRSDATGM